MIAIERYFIPTYVFSNDIPLSIIQIPYLHCHFSPCIPITKRVSCIFQQETLNILFLKDYFAMGAVPTNLAAFILTPGPMVVDTTTDLT